MYKDENRTRKLLESFQYIFNDLMGVPIQNPGCSLSVLNILRLNWISNQIKKRHIDFKNFVKRRNRITYLEMVVQQRKGFGKNTYETTAKLRPNTMILLRDTFPSKSF